MTTKNVTREQLQVLEDAYKLEKAISQVLSSIVYGIYPGPNWAKVLDGDALEAATTLENELLHNAEYGANIFGKQRPQLHETTSEALGLKKSVDVIDMYHVWDLHHYFTMALVGLYSLNALTKGIAQDLGQEYDKTQIGDALGEALKLVSDVSQVVEEWEEVAAQRFVKTGSARPAGEGAK